MSDSAAPASGSTAGSPDDPRVLAASVVHALYRLVKGCFLHDDSNQALVTLVDSVVEITHQFTARTGAPHASVLFANHSVFVNRQMLRASRDTYQLALELGELLAPCNVTEVTLETGVTAAEVAELGRAVAATHRDKKAHPRIAEGGSLHLRVRKVLGFGGGPILPAVTRVARIYAASILIVRAFYADLRQGKVEVSHGLKRVAQKISGALDDEKRLLLSTAATPPADADRAGVAVSSAILAVLVASQLSDDRVALTNLAMAALLYDSARVRLARTPSGALRSLNEEEEELLSTSSVVAMTSLGKLHPPSIARSVILYEALAMRSPATPPYGGARAPHILSRILVIARAFAELRVARGTSAPLSIDDAIDVLNAQATDNTTRSLVKLLVGTLGVFPAGTMVELSTGELAVVTATPRLPIDFARPPVRVLYDESARLLDEPFDIDLSAPPKGSTPRFVKKPIDASDQQMKQMRAYVMQLSSRKRTGPSPDRSNAAPGERLPTPARGDARGGSPRVSTSPRPLRHKTQDPRQDTEGGPGDEVVSSRPPRAKRQDSVVGSSAPGPSDEEQRFLADIGRMTRAAPLPRVEDPDSAEWSALPPPPEKRGASFAPSAPSAAHSSAPPGSAPPSSPRTPRPRDETGPFRSPRVTVSQPPRVSQALPASRSAPPPEPTPAREPLHERHVSEVTSTRQIDWDTDAVLARYLSDAPSAPGTDSVTGEEADPRSSRNAGLRWDRPSSSGGAASVPPSSGPRSSSCPPSSERASDAPSGREGAGREAKSSGGLRWSSQRPCEEPPASDSMRPDDDSPVPPPSSPPTSGRAKAGNLSWGGPKRGGK